MLTDIEKDTIDWDPNFDETKKEPSVLPCRFPNLDVYKRQLKTMERDMKNDQHLRETVSDIIKNVKA